MNKHKGKKYDSSLDIAEIAKLLRLEIKNNVSLGLLPKLKYSVTIQRYAGGRSLHVRVESGGCSRSFKNVAERYVHQKLDDIVESYNCYESDSRVDYWNGNFLGFVHVPSEQFIDDTWSPPSSEKKLWKELEKKHKKGWR